MLKSVTPFRQLARIYSSVLSATASLNRQQDTLAQLHQVALQSRAEAHDTSSNSSVQSAQMADRVADLSARLDTIAARPGIEGNRNVGHTWQDSAQLLASLRSELARTMPDNVALQGWNSYAQCDEDGMIRACLERLKGRAEMSGTFIEVGCGNGLENNTHQLLLDGYRGGWLDGSPRNIAFIAEHLGTLKSERLLVTEAFVTKETVRPLVAQFREHLDTADIDFFSFDLDGNDLHLMPLALEEIAPKIICVEYNGKFPPPTSLSMAYVGDHQWAEDDYYGATLQAWVDLFSGRYTLVSCNLSGVNAFFVRDDLVAAFKVYPVDQLYQPCRYWLVGNNGHRASMKWLKQKLAPQ
ncbi:MULTISPECIES: hypothetical protein [Variovorax]|jgi:hypothetical protein|uniref:hypothetical protein n=1 Tax=Variovorax TaxID=34072 RepID=UPI0008BAC91F|nr:hypothetical protein [Variovorax sp. OV084]SEU22897.1 hypothetical protein SAMN05443580_13433 [Variovorax sp. OV084]